MCLFPMENPKLFCGVSVFPKKSDKFHWTSVASHVLTLVEDMAGEAWSQPGVLPGQRAGSDDGRHSFGSCCLEDVAVACRPPSGELTHAPANPRVLYRAMTVFFTSVWGCAREPQSGFPDGAGGKGG